MKLNIRTLILSRKAAAIAAYLPGSSASGLICYCDPRDDRATRTAVALTGARALIIDPGLQGILLGLVLGVVICGLTPPPHGNPQSTGYDATIPAFAIP